MSQPQELQTARQALGELVSALPARRWTATDGQRFQVIRLARGLSQRAIAHKGCSAAYISRIEAGDRKPSITVLAKLALLTDTSYKHLARGVGEPLPLTEDERDWLMVLLGISCSIEPTVVALHEQLRGVFAKEEAARLDE